MAIIPCPVLPSWPRPVRITPQPLPLQGRPGATGQNTGFGQITYTERTVEASDFFAAGARGQVLFEPETVQDYLNPPFVGHAFWSNNKVVARAIGDLYEFQINLIVTAQIAGAQLRVDAEVGSSFGPVASVTVDVDTALGRSWAFVQIANADFSGGAQAYFDAGNNAIGFTQASGSFTLGTPTVTTVSGKKRLTFPFTAGVTGTTSKDNSLYLIFRMSNGNFGQSYQGVAGNGMNVGAFSLTEQ